MVYSMWLWIKALLSLIIERSRSQSPFDLVTRLILLGWGGNKGQESMLEMWVCSRYTGECVGKESYLSSFCLTLDAWASLCGSTDIRINYENDGRVVYFHIPPHTHIHTHTKIKDCFSQMQVLISYWKHNRNYLNIKGSFTLCLST